MHDVMHLAGIGYVDADRHAFAHLQCRPGNLPVVRQRLDGDAVANLELVLRNVQTVVGFPAGDRSAVLQMSWEKGMQRFVSEQHSSRRKKTPTVHESPVTDNREQLLYIA